MIKLLCKLLRQDPDSREGIISATSGLNILINILVAVVKVVVGMMASSIAIVSEGMNNATDALTSVLNALEKKGYVTRRRSDTDRRDLYAVITEKGMALRETAVSIPEKLGACVPLEAEEAAALYRILHKLMQKL